MSFVRDEASQALPDLETDDHIGKDDRNGSKLDETDLLRREEPRQDGDEKEGRATSEQDRETVCRGVPPELRLALGRSCCPVLSFTRGSLLSEEAVVSGRACDPVLEIDLGIEADHLARLVD